MLSLTNATESGIQRRTTTIIDDDTVGFTVTETSGGTTVNESGTTDTFDVVLNSQPLTNVVITDTSSDTGEATVNKATLTFTPANWNMAQTVTVKGVDDVILDGNQTSTVTLAIDDPNSDDAFDPLANQTVTVTTVDNDTATAALSVTTQGHETGPVNIVYTVTLSRINGTDSAITFDFDDLLTGTATAGSDYTAIPAAAKISVANGASTGTIAVPVMNDTTVELTETLKVGISNSSSALVTISTAAATANITDNDTATFQINDATVNEAAGAMTFTVTLSRPLDIPVSVIVSYANVTATGAAGGIGADYDNNTDTVSFAAGSTTAKTVTVAITNDNIIERNETFMASLAISAGTPPGARSIVTSDKRTGTITDNDAATSCFWQPRWAVRSSPTFQ